MYARVGRVSFSPDKADDLVAHVRNDVLSMYADQDGYRGFRLLVDRQNGTALGVSYWESADEMRASDAIGERARDGAAQAGEGGVESVEAFEIAIDEPA